MSGNHPTPPFDFFPFSLFPFSSSFSSIIYTSFSSSLSLWFFSSSSSAVNDQSHSFHFPPRSHSSSLLILYFPHPMSPLSSPSPFGSFFFPSSSSSPSSPPPSKQKRKTQWSRESQDFFPLFISFPFFYLTFFFPFFSCRRFEKLVYLFTIVCLFSLS